MLADPGELEAALRRRGNDPGRLRDSRLRINAVEARKRKLAAEIDEAIE